MKLLAFDTSTETLSIAVEQDGRLWQHQGAGGPQASATLIPAILVLLAQAGLRLTQLDAIAFGRGPGSFTGLRTACAVAQGLGFGASVPLLPVDTLLAVAEDARQQHGATQLVAALDARMDEVYHAAFAWAHGAWQQADNSADFSLCAPEAVAVPPGWALAGNAHRAYGERIAPGAARLDALPTAAALLRLAPALLSAGATVPADQALPRYIRDKVAKTTVERAAERAAQEAAHP
ncbi:MAG TPA: tRNA (adenosine(37)-N6)-threonylcarbamoyltransferase complex dimerization subunit type 1 TsaB [Burkholderiaceae bacterium]